MEEVLEYEGSTQDTFHSSTRRGGSNMLNSMFVQEHVVMLYPGESEEFVIKIFRPVGHRIKLEVCEFPRHVASITISPIQGIAPFTADIKIVVSPTARVGVYPWSLNIYDINENRVQGIAHIKLIILPPAITLERYRELRALYREYGIQLTLWHVLRINYPTGTNFSTIKGLYEVIVDSQVSKGTVGNILHVLVMKKLVERVRKGFYKPVETSLEDALARVDVKRFRGMGLSNHTKPNTYLKKAHLSELPEQVQKAYNVAVHICKSHGPLPALYFLLHTLLGARKTGFLLLWYGCSFIICEPKTHFCHYYESIVLSNLLQSLGLFSGVYYPTCREHEEAKKIAERYLHEHYSGYKEARRLHYLLRKEGYIGQLSNEPYVLKVYHYEDDTIGVYIYDYTGRELKFGVNVDTRSVDTVETWIALPAMHVSKKNEEVYINHE